MANLRNLDSWANEILPLTRDLAEKGILENTKKYGQIKQRLEDLKADIAREIKEVVTITTLVPSQKLNKLDTCEKKTNDCEQLKKELDQLASETKAIHAQVAKKDEDFKKVGEITAQEYVKAFKSELAKLNAQKAEILASKKPADAKVNELNKFISGFESGIKDTPALLNAINAGLTSFLASSSRLTESLIQYSNKWQSIITSSRTNVSIIRAEEEKAMMQAAAKQGAEKQAAEEKAKQAAEEKAKQAAEERAKAQQQNQSYSPSLLFSLKPADSAINAGKLSPPPKSHKNTRLGA